MLGWRRGEEFGQARDAGFHPAARTNNRLVLLAVAALLWALLILCRLVYLQIVSHDTYKHLAARQQQRTLTIDAPRGAILDRSDRPLALSVPVDSVCVNPLRVPDRPFAADILARVLDLDGQELLNRMEAAVERRARLGPGAPGTGFLWVKRKISPEESERLRSLNLEWVEFRKESQRYYPDGSLASHLVGTVDFQERGNLGLEQSLDSELRGRPGQVKMLTDVQHRGIESLDMSDPEPGKSVTLSIDERIQFVVEQELYAACVKHRARSGSAVVMNPHTGEILAMASYPSFDPNRAPAPGEDPSVRFHHPVSVPFEPGSVFKVVTMAAALETTNLRPDSPINCGGGTIKLFGRVIREARTGYGVLPMSDVLAKSSNVGSVQVALRMGEKNLLEYVRKFGFGSRTGIPLPAESAGIVRDLKRWGKTSIGSVAMGHEISATTLQLARACSAIANGGMLVQPRLVLRTQRPGGSPEEEPIEPPRRVLKAENAITMRHMMEGVVLRGTGKAARLTGYSSGGKTGTAQIFDFATRRYTTTYNSSYVGFAPVPRPAIVVAVTLNGVRLFGGVVAAPVFRAVASETLRLLDVPRDLPLDTDPPAPEAADTYDLAIAELAEPPEDLPIMAAAVPPDTEWTPWSGPGEAHSEPAGGAGGALHAVPSFQGKTLRAVLEESVAMGVPVDVTGSGVAQAQEPAAGSLLKPGERVQVQFQ